MQNQSAHPMDAQTDLSIHLTDGDNTGNTYSAPVCQFEGDNKNEQVRRRYFRTAR